ncbi:MAG TPA: hypothetical protein VF585_11240 [Chthoniobacterales bacterium]|jgi:putative addiction module antidote
MILKLKLRKVGDSDGVILPEEALAHMQVNEGDVITLTEAGEGSLRMSAHHADVSHQMLLARDITERYRNTLRNLAK